MGQARKILLWVILGALHLSIGLDTSLIFLFCVIFHAFSERVEGHRAWHKHLSTAGAVAVCRAAEVPQMIVDAVQVQARWQFDILWTFAWCRLVIENSLQKLQGSGMMANWQWNEKQWEPNHDIYCSETFSKTLSGWRTWKQLLICRINHVNYHSTLVSGRTAGLLQNKALIWRRQQTWRQQTYTKGLGYKTGWVRMTSCSSKPILNENQSTTYMPNWGENHRKITGK